MQVQWDDRHNAYLAFSPTLFKIARMFKLKNDSMAYGSSLVEAVASSEKAIQNILEELKNFRILPPEPDIKEKEKMYGRV